MNTHNYPTWLAPVHIAKELKKIGFDEPCLIVYHEVFDEEMIFISFEGDDYCYYYADLSECSQRTNSEMGKDILELGKHYSYACSLPTWEQVFEWFRERGLHCSIRYLVDLETYSYYIHDSCNWYKGSGNRDTYEEAIEACVEDLIKIFNENKDR